MNDKSLESTKRNRKALSIISFVIGIGGIFFYIFAVIADFLQDFGLYLGFGGPLVNGMLYALPFVGLATIVLSILAIVKERHRVMAVFGLVLTSLWLVVAGWIFVTNLSYDIERDAYRVCESSTGTCVTNSFHNTAGDVRRSEDRVKNALPYVTNWEVANELDAQKCTIEGRNGDEWIKTISATTSESRSTVFADAKAYWQKTYDESDGLKIDETGDTLTIILGVPDAPSSPDLRTSITVTGEVINVQINSGCFESHPEKYQTYIDYDNENTDY